MKKILLSFILAGIGFSTAFAQEQAEPAIKATFDGKTVYYKTGDSPVLSYKVDDAEAKHALISLKDRTYPVLDVTLTSENNLEIEHANYVAPEGLSVSDLSGYIPFKANFPVLTVKWGDETLDASEYQVTYKDDEGNVVVDEEGEPTEPSALGSYTRLVTLTYPYYGTVEHQFTIEYMMTVNFDANTGEGTMDPYVVATHKGNNPSTLPKNTFTKTGYHFYGWNQKSDATASEFDDESEMTVSDSFNGGTDGEMTLYAIWAKDMELQAATQLVITNIPDIVDYGNQIPAPTVTDFMEEEPATVAPDKYVVAYETAEGQAVNGTPSEPGKYNLCVTFKYPYWGTVKKAFEIVDHWDFTDADFASADSKFKAGKYGEGKAKYTREGDDIATDNYATFCLPMDIEVTYGEDAQFSSVYLPLEFAILNQETHILKLFLTKVEEGETVPAGTPFFAQIACDGKLLLTNSSELTVDEDPASVYKHTTTIKVYDQSANSSFVILNKDIQFVWNGTFQKTTETDDKFLFYVNGTFGKAGSSITAFRAYLEQESWNDNVKNIMDIEVDLGDSDEATAIRNIIAGSSDDTQIYSIDGKKMGNDMKSLNKGVYIINGKKVLK